MAYQKPKGPTLLQTMAGIIIIGVALIIVHHFIVGV